MNYLLAFVCSLVSCFFKGLQHKNITHNMYGMAVVISFLLAFLDVFLVGLVARSDWTIAFASAFGAAIGLVAGMYTHTRFARREPFTEV